MRVICVGVTLMLIAAAIIERYMRQSHLSNLARLALAGATTLFWFTYLTTGISKEKAR